MHIILLAILLQGKPPAKEPASDLTATHSQTVPERIGTVSVPQISRREETTTPGLNPDSEIHAQMERDIGGEQEAVSYLKFEFAGLQGKVDKNTGDIEDLKLDRSHFLWVVSLLATVLTIIGSVLALVRKIIWTDMVRPRLKKAMSDPTQD